MRNEYIELVKKWLADNDSVSSEALRVNADAAYAADAYAAADDWAAYAAAYAAADDWAADASDAAQAAEAAGSAAGHVADLVKRYEELLWGS